MYSIHVNGAKTKGDSKRGRGECEIPLLRKGIASTRRQMSWTSDLSVILTCKGSHHGSCSRRSNACPNEAMQDVMLGLRNLVPSMHLDTLE